MTDEMEDIHRQAADLESYRRHSLRGEDVPDDNFFNYDMPSPPSSCGRKQDNNKNIRRYTSKTLKSGGVRRKLVY